MVTVRRVISGGQTGADRGALLAAIDCGIEHGGYCPSGRRAEDGRIPDMFLLVEDESPSYPRRTARNIHEADATLILSRNGVFDRGTGLTIKLIDMMDKPFVRLSLRSDGKQVDATIAWLRKLASLKQRLLIVNVAGPRESRVPGLQEDVRRFMCAVIEGSNHEN